jgi:dihydroneopterin aldolase
MATVEIDIDMSELAGQIDLHDLASEINYDDLKDSLSYSEVADNVDLDALASIVIMRLQASESLIENLAAKIAAKINTNEVQAWKIKAINAIAEIY